MSIEELLLVHESIEEIWASLEKVAPQKVAQLRELTALKESLLSGAKSDLRDMGPGQHQFGDLKFSVKKGSTKQYADPKEFVIQAQNRDEVDFLLATGVLEYEVNMTQYERLPEETKAAYADLFQTKQASHRVYLPKELTK